MDGEIESRKKTARMEKDWQNCERRAGREIVTTSSSTLCNDNLVHSMGAFCGDKVRRGPSLASNES